MLRQKGRDGGRATLPPAPRPGGRGSLREPGGKGAGMLQGGGVPAVAGEGRAQPRERRRRAGQSTEAIGPGLPHLQVRGRGRGSSRGGQQRQTGSEGRKKGCCTTEGAGALGRGRAGVGEAHDEVSPPRRTVFCGRNSLERRQWSGMFTAGGKTISNSSGEMCHPNVTGKLT